MGRKSNRKKNEDDDSGIEISSTEGKDEMKVQLKKNDKAKVHKYSKKNKQKVFNKKGSKFSIIDSIYVLFKSGSKL